jgi:hypothetical protein
LHGQWYRLQANKYLAPLFTNPWNFKCFNE